MGSDIKKPSVNQMLREFCDANSNIIGVLLSSIDGHPRAHCFRKSMQQSRLAAMASSAIALGESMSREAGQKSCQFVISQNDDGYIVCIRVGARHSLTAFASSEINLGMLLAGTRNTAESLLEGV